MSESLQNNSRWIITSHGLLRVHGLKTLRNISYGHAFGMSQVRQPELGLPEVLMSQVAESRKLLRQKLGSVPR